MIHYNGARNEQDSCAARPGVVKFASLDVELPLAAIYEDTATWARKGRAAASETVELEDEE